MLSLSVLRFLVVGVLLGCLVGILQDQAHYQVSRNSDEETG